MISTADESTPFRFSTDDLPRHERGTAVRELYERNMLPVKLEPLPDCFVHADFTRWTLPGLGILSGTLCGLRQEGTPERSAHRANDDLFLGTNLAGSSRACQRGREVALHDGDAVLLTREQGGFTISRPTQVRFVGLRLFRTALAPLVTHLDDAVIRLIPRDTGALKLLRKYLSVVVDDEALATPDLRRLVVTQVYDLAAVTIGATREAAAMAEGRGVRAARLRVIKCDIVANLGDHLAVTAVALRHHMTPRYVHKLFESEGTTFSDFVRRERLARARRLLTSPHCAERTIASVAFDVGFGDLSYFNRSFRRCYGATPSEVRAEARSRVGHLGH